MDCGLSTLIQSFPFQKSVFPIMLTNLTVLHIEYIQRFKNFQIFCLSNYPYRKISYVPSSLNFCTLYIALHLHPLFPSAWPLSLDHDPLDKYFWIISSIYPSGMGKLQQVCGLHYPHSQKVPRWGIFCHSGNALESSAHPMTGG